MNQMPYPLSESEIENEKQPFGGGPRPWQIESVIESRKLKVQLEAAALDHQPQDKALRSRAMDLLHGALFRGRMIAKERLEAGADGLDTARLLAAVQNEVIKALFDFTANIVYGDSNRTEGEKLAVLAVGGYGRNVLAPSSDIDLLFLRNYKQTPWAESVIEYMLYMMWDMGLKVGHAFRTVDECMRLAKEDLNTETALLDARFICGDDSIADMLTARYREELVKGRGAQFIAAKLEERDKRHKKQGDSRYVVEPNVKEGKGGLRDLQTLFWLVRHAYGGVTLEDILAQREVFTEDEAATFRNAGRFLWSVRCHIHYLTGRPEERLSFDLQPEIASRMGFEDKGSRLGVERFMKRYFREAKAVGALTRILCARLEADQQKAKPNFLHFLPFNSGPQIETPGFAMDSGRITIEDDQFFQNQPVEMLRLFKLAEDNNVDIHPRALSAVTRSLNEFGETEQTDPEARALFIDLLINTSDPGPIMRLMNEAGLLGEMVPEFGEIVAQTQFNMYHHFTVDEHTLRAVDAIAEIERGGTDFFPLGTELFPTLEHKRALYLAMLLHDTGKGLGDQQVEGEKTAIAASSRLGLDEDECTLIGWLVRNHLEMSDCAQKRDISDPRTITQFAERVQTLERLKLLLILTVADITAVGPDIWNGWKGQLLKELYELTAAVLSKEEVKESLVASQLNSRAESARQSLVSRKGELPKLLAQMESGYWTSQSDDELNWHHDLLTHSPIQTIVECNLRPETESVELLVATWDRTALFSDIVGALVNEEAHIAAAQIYTGKSGGVLDIFVLQDEDGHMFGRGEDNRLLRLKNAVAAAIENGVESVRERKSLNARREAAFVVDPDVVFDNQGSAEQTIIEVTGKERPALLFELARALSSRGIVLHSAHAGTYGERIHDTFYVQTVEGKKLENQEDMDGLASTLLDILSANTQDAPRTPAQKLAQAKSADSF
ncbi:[protein-PII] uridylyltransferase [Ponticaulis sp.]|uniref:[protein-PII] uridylyltransferase n=1 Tax=Ponticaulis sp. TaxID=2020902 RepID=UPI0025F4370F|nr:[protein-PII] uridylyltransferase [Ponticaulis sp.]|tara:strand:+ start:63764 stop:66622 length:2859 start_codon:yes stop_codon:yes gene_type:complete